MKGSQATEARAPPVGRWRSSPVVPSARPQAVRRHARPAAAAALAPEFVTVLLSCVGLVFVIAGKVTLGRSFALLPANRGIVSTGLYRFVRHPIYMGYLVTHIAFLIASPSAWNIAALVIADAALLARAVCEEQTLAKDPAYRDYQSRVRWRVLPGVF